MIRRTRPLLWQVGIPLIAAEVVLLFVVAMLARSIWRAVETDSIAAILIVFGVAALLFTLIAVLIVSRFVARQARMMSGAATQFARGDFSRHVVSPSSRELADLATALDEMGDALNARFAELQQQQRQQRAILQSMSNAVLAVDTEQRIAMVNRAAEELLGLRSDSVRGRLLQEVIRQPELNGFVLRALSDPAPQQTELRLQGEPPMIVQAISGPLTTADGAPAGLLLVLNDVTELRRLETLRSDFAANVSHELRTPITNLKGYVETLLDVGTADESQAKRFLEVIQHNIDRLAAIVDDVMALTEFERPRSRERLKKTLTPVRDIAAAVLEQFAPAARQKNIELKSVVPDDLHVKVQPRLIEQALGNLVSNAITYSPGGTSVTIEVLRTRDDEIEIAVADEGPGIAREHLSRLFERFYRVDLARSREVGGTGLGLAIVKHIALTHGGSADVTSTLGKGSRFVIKLPYA